MTDIQHNIQQYPSDNAVDADALSRDCIMVAISTSPLSSRLVRAGYRMAQQLDARFIAVHIDNTTQQTLDGNNEQLKQTIHLAETLGASIITVTGKSISDTLLRVARENHVTKLIVGQTLRSRWQELIRGSIINHLIRQSDDIDVYVISASKETLVDSSLQNTTNLNWHGYLAGLGIVAFTTFIGALIDVAFELNPTNLVMIYLLAIVFASIRYGYGVAALMSFLSVVIFNITFVPPRFTFRVADAEYILTFIGLGGVGLVTAYLASQVRRLAVSAQNREQQTARLYAFSQDLATATNVDDIFTTLLSHTKQILASKVVILLPKNDTLTQQIATPDYILSKADYEAAVWTYEHGQQAGKGTYLLSEAQGFYRPLKITHHILGVIGIQTNESLLPDQERLLDAFVSQFTLALDAKQLYVKAQEAELLSAKETLQRTILNSVSHDLRTPLVSVKGALSSLLDDDHTLTAEMKQELLVGAYEEADRLNRLVGNLLEMSRLQTGSLNLKREPYALEEIISVARTQLQSRLNGHRINVNIEADLPLIKVDLVLFAQVIVNLLDNAAKYSEDESVITIQVYREDSHIMIDVLDDGIGIPEADLPHIFDKFFRASSVNRIHGSGLGLSIVQGIVDLHNATIHANNRAEGGSIFSIAIPLTETLSIITGN